MSSEPVISARALGKCYQLYQRPQDRLKQFLWRGRRRYFREFWALRDVSFELGRGEVLGIVGRNGAGKSTLLQLLCGTLSPTVGEIAVHGRVAALLELGAGFNPDFTGRENVFMNAAVIGIPEREIAARFDEIVDFSGIRDFIDQPVKTYSSGMYVRLAFSVAVSVDPDILIVDEALSVGDGEFSRRSFERIMRFRDEGKTILLCSHALYQIEAFCDRALWLDHGQMRLFGDPAEVISAYTDHLAGATDAIQPPVELQPAAPGSAATTARIVAVDVDVDGRAGRNLTAETGKSMVQVRIRFAADPALPTPSVAVGFVSRAGITVATAGSVNDGIPLRMDAFGNGEATVTFPKFPLLKGEYTVAAFLLCERGLLRYDQTEFAAEIQVRQSGLEQGIVTLPHVWKCSTTP